MRLLRDVRRTVPSDWWAAYVHVGLHSSHCSASWHLTQRPCRHMLEIREMPQDAHASAVASPPIWARMLYRRPCMHALKVACPGTFSSDGALGARACRRTLTVEASLPTERMGPPAVHRSSFPQSFAGTPTEDPQANGSIGGLPGSAGITGGPEALPMAGIISSSSSSSSDGTEEFAEIYSPQKSRERSPQSPGSHQNVEAFAGQGGATKVEDHPQGVGPASSTSTDKKARPPRRQREKPPLMSATNAAVAHIRELVNSYNERLQQQEAKGAAPQPRACGIRVSLQKQGCSGMAYDVAICTEEPSKSPCSSPNPADKATAADVGQPEAAPSTGNSRRSKDWREDEVVGVGGVEIRVAADAVMLLVGTQVDFVDEEVQTGFVFNNPNQRQSCGCGKSFMV